MQTAEDFAQAMLAMPEPLRADVITSFVAGVLIRARDDGRLPDVIASALGAYGIAIVIVDENGARLRDAWSTNNPRGAAVTQVMDRVHDAITEVLNRMMDAKA